MIKSISCLSCMMILAVSFTAMAVDTTKIEQVRTQFIQSNSQPDKAAEQIIDEFWRKSLDSMMLVEDTGEIVSLRSDLVKQKGDKDLSLYASTYVKIADTHLKSALEAVAKWENNDAKKLRIERNFMILIAELGRMELADLAITRLNHDDKMVRYWAVRAVTSPRVVSQLISDITRDEKLTLQIVTSLGDYVKQYDDAIVLPFIAEFAAGIKNASGNSLLVAIADKRIEAYMKWTVTDEASDAGVLKSIGGLVFETASAAARQELLGRFGQLYSCVVQRYLIGKNLPASSRDQLVTVICEVEAGVMEKGLPGSTNRFRNELQRAQPIDKVYEALFGTSGKAGEFSTRMNFDYGKDSSGKSLVAPRPLPAPPAAPSEAAAQP